MSIHETRIPLRLGGRDDGRPVTPEEFAEADFDEPWRYERVGGRLVVMAPSGEDHVSTSEPWRDRLGAYKLTHPEIVDKVVSEAWVRVDGDTDRIGDIGVYLRSEAPTPPIPDRVPDLMYEFLSPGQGARRGNATSSPSAPITSGSASASTSSSTASPAPPSSSPASRDNSARGS